MIAAAGFVAAGPASAHSLGGRTLHRGARGSDVSALQADLSQAGFVTTANGRFTAETAADVKRFQRFYELKPTGIADAHTIAVVRRVDTLDDAASDTSDATVKVKQTKAKPGFTNDTTTLIKSNPVLAPVQQNGGSAHLGNRILKAGMHGHDVRVLQAYLTIDGYSTGGVDGDFGSSTESSVVSWQSASDVADNGVVTYADSRLLREDVAKVESSPKSVTDPTPRDGADDADHDAGGHGDDRLRRRRDGAGERSGGRPGDDRGGQLDRHQAVHLRRRSRHVERSGL